MSSKQMGEAATEAEAMLEAVIGRVPEWTGRAASYCSVTGGITNATFRVAFADGPDLYFIKVPGKGTEKFIDRRIAHEAAKNAGQTGLGPRVFHFFDDTGVEVSEFVDGYRSCNNVDFQNPVVRALAVDCYQRFHAGPLLGQTKTVFDMIDEHIGQVAELASPVPDDAVWLLRQYALARAALEASGLDLTSCFNDPIAMNFMLSATAETMLLVDYEYASNNDRCYDLGVWFGEMFFSERVENELIERYFGRVASHIFARVQLHKALADIKWGYWSLVQMKQSTLDFDYAKYGAWKFLRARSIMHDWRWPDWLASV